MTYEDPQPTIRHSAIVNQRRGRRRVYGYTVSMDDLPDHEDAKGDEVNDGREDSTLTRSERENEQGDSSSGTLSINETAERAASNAMTDGGPSQCRAFSYTRCLPPLRRCPSVGSNGNHASAQLTPL